MKTRFIWLGIIAAIIGIGTFFIGCDNDVNGIVIYHGQVVYINTTTPFADLTVKVTDGINTHCQTQTNAEGMFSLKVRVDEIDGSYYLLAGDSTCIPKKVTLGGYGQAEVDLGIIEVEGPKKATIKTNEPTDITSESARVGGNVIDDGRANVTERGICYSKKRYPELGKDQSLECGKGIGEFSTILENLEHDATYYIRAYAVNHIGISYGEQVVLTTLSGLANVTTNTEPISTATTISAGGNVISDGGYKVTERGVCYSNIISEPTVEDEKVTKGYGKGEFSVLIVNLSPSTIYYVRAYAINENGVSYGDVISVRTTEGLPIVETSFVSYGGIFDFNSTKFSSLDYTIRGNVVDDGGSEITARGICYSDQPYPAVSSSSIINAEKGIGYYSCIIEGITTYNKTYYIRAFAANDRGTSYGNQLELTPQMMNYHALPMLEYGGYVYKIYDMKGTMTWPQAYDACNNLQYGGYDDWYLPNKEELTYIMSIYIGFKNNRDYYWSSSDDGTYHYAYLVQNNFCYTYKNSYSYYVLAVRKDKK